MLCDRCKKEITCISQSRLNVDQEYKVRGIKYTLHKNNLCLDCLAELKSICEWREQNDM